MHAPDDSPSGPGRPSDPALLPMPLRVVCTINAAVWLVARPPWFQTDPVNLAGAITGAAMWALLGFGGNRPGRMRQATIVVAAAYLGMLVARLLLRGP